MKASVFVAALASCFACGAAIVKDPQIFNFRPDAIWPFCGRIYENPPAGWNETQGCPVDRFGNSDFQEEIRSTFGPRPLKSDGERFDFHRGIDVSAPVGSPLFAIADGSVDHWGPKSGYTDPVIILRIYRPGEGSCSSKGCYHALYLHARDNCCAHLTIGQEVKKGDFLGYSGASSIGNYAHVHFELRSAAPDDPFSNWQQDCVHPLHVLPYRPPQNAVTELSLHPKLSPDGHGAVEVVLDTDRKDIISVQVTVVDANGAEIPQPGNTPNAKGYNVRPSFFDFDVWNRQWSHKDSTSVPWESFNDEGGARECPFRHQHGAGYSAHYHLDASTDNNDKIGQFNGITVTLLPYAYYGPGTENATAGEYYTGKFYLNISFDALEGLDERAACIDAVAEAVSRWNYTTRICREDVAWPYADIPYASHPWDGAGFDFANCKDNRTWDELSDVFGEDGPSPGFVTGGLGRLMERGHFEVWACMRDHPCLANPGVGAVIGDFMCFAFDEHSMLFLPWGKESDLNLFTHPP